jgi:uroporphyrinogen-III decarboxylase
MNGRERILCHQFFSTAAEIVHRHGKHLMVHACGRSKAILPLVGEARIDALEGVTPPPMGDVRQMTGYDGFMLHGGMDGPHQQLTENAESLLHAYVRDLFASLPDRRHFIFASSFNTSPRSPWRNLLAFRDAAREYGRMDN